MSLSYVFCDVSHLLGGTIEGVFFLAIPILSFVFGWLILSLIVKVVVKTKSSIKMAQSALWIFLISTLLFFTCLLALGNGFALDGYLLGFALPIAIAAVSHLIIIKGQVIENDQKLRLPYSYGLSTLIFCLIGYFLSSIFLRFSFVPLGLFIYNLIGLKRDLKPN